MIDFVLANSLLKYIGSEFLVSSNNVSESGFKRVKSIEFDAKGATFRFENSKLEITKNWCELEGFKPKKKTDLVEISNLEALEIGDTVLYTAWSKAIENGWLLSAEPIRKQVVGTTERYATLTDGSRVNRLGELQTRLYKIQRLRVIENNVKP